MPKFFVVYELGNIRVQAEADTASEALQHIETIGTGMAAIRERFVANEPASPPRLTLVKDDVAELAQSIRQEAAPTQPAQKKSRTDQKKGAKIQQEPAVQPTAEEALSAPVSTPVAHAPVVTAPADVPAPVGAAKIDIGTALRNFARAKGVPAATALVASFKNKDTGEAAARVDQIAPADYAAMLAKIEGKSK